MGEKYHIDDLSVKNDEQLHDIKEICLMNKGLTFLPASITKLVNLELMWLSGNNLTTLPKGAQTPVFFI
jgi:hypothetical protein